MTQTDTLLVTILAKTDAIFRPLRAIDWATPTAPASLWESRQRFAESGVSLSAGDNRAAQSAMRALEARGLLTLHGQTRDRSAKLTDLGDACARSLAGLPDTGDAHRALRKVVRLSVKAGLRMLAPETLVAGIADYGVPKAQCQLHEAWLVLAPIACRGLVEGLSDRAGRVYYAPTATGTTWAKRPRPAMPEGLPDWSKEAEEVYFAATKTARVELRSAAPENGAEIGFIPMPVSVKWQD